MILPEAAIICIKTLEDEHNLAEFLIKNTDILWNGHIKIAMPDDRSSGNRIGHGNNLAVRIAGEKMWRGNISSYRSALEEERYENMTEEWFLISVDEFLFKVQSDFDINCDGLI